MVNKVNKDAFKKLKNLKPSRRMAFAKSPVGQSMLSLLTPSQFADLFPRYYEQGLPNVEGFRREVSKKSQQKQQEYFESIDEKLGTTSPGAAERAGREGASRRGGGAGGATTGGSVTNRVMAKQIYDYLLSKGVDHTHAVGILANIQRESGFNAANDTGDNGTSFGLFQHHKDRADRMKAMAGAGGQDWRQNWKGQVDYALSEPETKKYLSQKFGSSSEASDYFLTVFERPSEANRAKDIAKSRSYIGHIETIATGGGSTPSSGTGTTTQGGTHQISGGGFIQPKDGTLYDKRNSEECATLGKAFNPNIGRASSWNVSYNPGAIQPGVTVATMQYNNGPSRHGAGFHTGVALSAPDKDGNFLILEQSSGRPAHVRMINMNNYGGIQGNHFGIINGNTDRSMDALLVGRGLASDEHRKVIDGNLQQMQSSNAKTVASDPEKVSNVTPNDVKTNKATAEIEKTHEEHNINPGQPVTAQVKVKQLNTAEVIKPTAGTFDVNKEAFLAKIREMEPLANMAGEDRIRTGFNDDPRVKKAGVYIDENWQMHAKDVNNANFKEATKDFGGGIIKPSEKRSEAPSNKQTASLDADAQFMKASYSPGGDKATSSVGAQMRGKIEEYYGKKISEREYEMLIRATHAESTARGHSPEEHAMIMGSILNRGKKEGGIEKALMKNKQFESVTGRTRGRFHPNAAYKAGPSADRMGAINEGVMNYLHRVPSNQEYFASATVKTKFLKKSILPGKFGTPQRHADTMFGNSLLPETKNKVAEAPKNTGAIPMESTVNRGDKTPTTPKSTIEPPKPSTTERMAKEIFQGGGKNVEAAPAKAAAPTTPTSTSTPTTPTASPAPPSPSNNIRTEPVLNVDNPVRGASDGGSFDANGTVSIRPMDRKDDHALISNNGGRDQVIGTVQSGERIDVTPQQKVNGNMGPTDNGLRGEFEALRQQIGNNLSTAGEPTKQSPKTIQQRPDNDMTKFNASINNQNKNKQWHNDAFARAMNRTRLQETGDPLNNHFSGGNTNYS